ncbi:MAG: cadherin-like beta sandwich domain-containing protein [Propionibacteriaceae bacterium]|jgi:alpha-tubulin suppressor-like RCC1 family protein|nr:cadherin-like beta sandwich domain-containing protein [Propionibacteriaceae bacterium]
MTMTKTKKLAAALLAGIVSVGTLTALTPAPMAQAETATVIEVAVGYEHAAALFSNGDLYSWGKAAYVGDGTAKDRYKPVKVASGVKSVSAGHGQTAYLKNDGSVWIFGSWLASDTYKQYPKKVATGVAKLVAGYDAIFILKTNGDLYSSGYNSSSSGTLGLGMTEGGYVKEFKKVGSGFTDVFYSGGYVLDHTAFALKGTTLYGWGANDYGQVGDGTAITRYAPVKVMDDVVAFEHGAWYGNAAITSDGSVYTWGGVSAFTTGSLQGQGKGAAIIESPVKVIDGPTAGPIVDVSISTSLASYLKADGTVLYSGSGCFVGAAGGVCDLPEAWVPTPLTLADGSLLAGVASVSAADQSSFFLKADGTLLAIGKNLYGELGLGGTMDLEIPTVIETGVQKVWASHWFENATFILKSDGLYSSGGAAYNGLNTNVKAVNFAKLTFKSNALFNPPEGKLKSLKVSTGKLSPKFSASKYSYKLKIPAKKASVKLTFAKNDTKAKVAASTGGAYKNVKSLTVKLAKGKTKTVKLRVTGSGGYVNTYTIKITRAKK